MGSEVLESSSGGGRGDEFPMAARLDAAASVLTVRVVVFGYSIGGGAAAAVL